MDESGILKINIAKKDGSWTNLMMLKN
jgi:hypothetical protein